jgi:hypothetical protein
LLIERAANGVEVLQVGEDEWRFAAALHAGEPLEKALGIVLDSDLVSILARHLAAGRFVRFRLTDNYPSPNSDNAL